MNLVCRETYSANDIGWMYAMSDMVLFYLTYFSNLCEGDLGIHLSLASDIFWKRQKKKEVQLHSSYAEWFCTKWVSGWAYWQTHTLVFVLELSKLVIFSFCVWYLFLVFCHIFNLYSLVLRFFLVAIYTLKILNRWINIWSTESSSKYDSAILYP